MLFTCIAGTSAKNIGPQLQEDYVNVKSAYFNISSKVPTGSQVMLPLKPDLRQNKKISVP